MHLWFQEPYESLDELTALYDKHIHSMDERRFVVDVDGAFAGHSRIDGDQFYPP